MASYGALDESPPLSGARATRAQQHGSSSHESFTQICSLQWFARSSLPQIYFVASVFIIAALAFYTFTFHSLETGFILAGIFGLCTNLFAFNHFRSLFGLKRELEHFDRSIKALHYESIRLNREVHTLNRGNSQLKDAEGSLKRSNLKMMDMNRKFEAVNKSLTSMNVDSLKTLQGFQGKIDNMKERYYQVSLRQQRQALCVYRNVIIFVFYISLRFMC